jgi:hypothetical protein
MKHGGLTLAFVMSMFITTTRAADVSGSWKLDGAIGQFPIDLVCSLTQTDAQLTGTCKGDPIGELPVRGEVGANDIRWSYDVNFQGQQVTIVYIATLESATNMKGSVEVMGMPAGQFTGRKQ